MLLGNPERRRALLPHPLAFLQPAAYTMSRPALPQEGDPDEWLTETNVAVVPHPEIPVTMIDAKALAGGRLAKSFKYSLWNNSSKGLVAYQVVFHVESDTGAKATLHTTVDGFLGRGDIRAGDVEEMREQVAAAPSAIQRITAQVVYAEFDDGSTYGDNHTLASQLHGQRAEALAVYRKLLLDLAEAEQKVNQKSGLQEFLGTSSTRAAAVGMRLAESAISWKRTAWTLHLPN